MYPKTAYEEMVNESEPKRRMNGGMFHPGSNRGSNEGRKKSTAERRPAWVWLV